TYPDLPADFTYLQVSAGYWHSLAVGSDGNAYAWGSNSQGQLGDGTYTERYAPVRVKTPDRKTYPDLPAIRWRVCRLPHHDRRFLAAVCPVAELAIAVGSPCVGVPVAAYGQGMRASGADLHVGEIRWRVCRLP
ncbi:hypothetical protein QRX46_08755, partial [Bifidobacterium sp. H1HS10N]|nr:hypothetical protein [Bifidobacterium sp. H1HS10N]